MYIISNARSIAMSLWKRGFLEIVSSILECLLENPLRKTHITFKCNLDSRAVTKYISVMTQIGLIKKPNDNPGFYSITQKGIKYQILFQDFVSLMENDLKELIPENLESSQIVSYLKMGRK